MIFKLQLSVAPLGKVLIYNEGRTCTGEIALTPNLTDLFDGRMKIYAHGYIDSKGLVHLEEEAETQAW